MAETNHRSLNCSSIHPGIGEGTLAAVAPGPGVDEEELDPVRAEPAELGDCAPEGQRGAADQGGAPAARHEAQVRGGHVQGEERAHDPAEGGPGAVRGGTVLYAAVQEAERRAARRDGGQAAHHCRVRGGEGESQLFFLCC